MMFSRIAIKRLTIDDLSFFKVRSSFQQRLAGGIDLDSRLLEQFYPSLPQIIEQRHGQIMLTLNLYGPGLAQAYNLPRKIQKKGSYKNYRLNGEVIDDPTDTPERFHLLRPGDFVIFDFIGEIEPHAARVVFIAASVDIDSPLHTVLTEFIGNRSMVDLQPHILEKLLAGVSLPEKHPAYLLILEANLEDAAFDGIAGVSALRSGPYLGKVSRQDLDQARKNAERTGRLGEELLIEYFQKRKDSGLISDFHWDADENAISPYDYSVTEIDGSMTLIDVKSTRGNFNGRIHISYNELLQMSIVARYDLYRVYEITDDHMKLRIAQGLSKFAEKVISVMGNLPFGVQPDSVSVSPDSLPFSREIIVKVTET